MASELELTVLAQDPEDDAIPRRASLRVVRQTSARLLGKASHLFVLSSATSLPEVARIVRDANRAHKLRALFVRRNVRPDWLVHMLDRAKLRALRNMLVHVGPDVPRRVLKAWSIGAQHALIADAAIVGDRLLIKSCALEDYELPLEQAPLLASLSPEERTNFTVADDGSYVYWPAADLHIDLEAVRTITDPQWRQRAAAARAVHDRRFGQAVASVRHAAGLRLSDIAGISERQMRRIEQGARPRMATLGKMAQAHGMSLSDYLEGVARAAPGPRSRQT